MSRINELIAELCPSGVEFCELGEVTQRTTNVKWSDVEGEEFKYADSTPKNLNAEATRAFIDSAFRNGVIATTGTAITTVLPPVSRFSKSNGHSMKKQSVIEKLAAFFERYFGLA